MRSRIQRLTQKDFTRRQKPVLVFFSSPRVHTENHLSLSHTQLHATTCTFIYQACKSFFFIICLHKIRGFWNENLQLWYSNNVSVHCLYVVKVTPQRPIYECKTNINTVSNFHMEKNSILNAHTIACIMKKDGKHETKRKKKTTAKKVRQTRPHRCGKTIVNVNVCIPCNTRQNECYR